jgi:diaminopropionate ammonia-lyase
MQSLPSISTNYFMNPGFQHDEPYGAQRALILNAGALASAEQEITAWPGYQVTPLHALDGLADALGVALAQYVAMGVRNDTADPRIRVTTAEGMRGLGGGELE